MLIKKMFNGAMVLSSFIVITALFGALIDGIYIGRYLGKDCTAAYGLISPIVAIIALIGGILSSGAATHLSQFIAKGEKDNSNKLFSMILIEAIILFAIIGLSCWIFRFQLVHLLGATGNSEYLGELMIEYLKGLIPSFFILILIEFLNQIMQYEGDRIASLLNIIILTVTDILFDSLNVFVFHGGMFGMALATTMSYFISSIIFVIHFMYHSTFVFQLKDLPWKKAWTYFQSGIPNGIARLCIAVRSIAINKILVAVSTSVAVAAFSVTNSFGTFITAFGNGAGMSCVMIAGICLADYDKNGLKQLLKLGTTASFIITAVISAVAFVFSDSVASIFFHGNAATVLEASILIKYFCVYAPLYCLGSFFFYYLQGIQKVKLSTLFCIFINCGFVILSALILGHLKGKDGVWMAFPVAGLLSVLLVFIAAWISSGKLPFSYEKYTFSHNDIDSSIKTIEHSITREEEINPFSQMLMDKCIEFGVNKRKSYLCALCVEELLENTFSYGFVNTKEPCIDVKLVNDGKKLSLRVRDNGKLFNPVEFFSFNNDEDVTKMIGLRIVTKSSTDIRYESIMKYNNIIIVI